MSRTRELLVKAGVVKIFVQVPGVDSVEIYVGKKPLTDTKGDAHQTYAPVLEKYYGYKTYVIDLRNPTRSDSYNLMYLVNKYNDRYESTKSIDFALPLKYLSTGISASHFGFATYHEILVGVSFARDFSSHFSFGVAFNYFSTYFAESSPSISFVPLTAFIFIFYPFN
jgi:hypothetical protein